MSADITYGPKIQEREGGDLLAVASGGVLDIESGGALKFGGVDLTIPVPVYFTNLTVTGGALIVDRAYQVNSIYGRTSVSAASAATLTFYKAGSGVGMASGTQISTGAFDLASTANVNKSIALTASVAALTLATGDALGWVLTGASETTKGSVTFNLKPI